MKTLLRYFLRGRPFHHLTTRGLHLLYVGNSISLFSGLVRQVWTGWPSSKVEWVIWMFPILALLLLGLVVQAAAREYWRRPDRPKHIWHINLNFEK